MSYYKDELNKVDTKGDYSPSLQIRSEKGNTKWLGLNKESVQALREWLDENYPTEMVMLGDIEDRKSEMDNFGRDTR